MNSSPPTSPTSENNLPMPPLFARETRLLGWQGITLTHPAAWYLRTFGGNHQKGSLRMTDDDGLRLEIVWETRSGADVPASIGKLLSGLEKEAKKKDAEFRRVEKPQILQLKGRGRKQTTNFGWLGQSDDPIANQGWGAAWQCETCGRVVVTHLIGRQHETPAKTQQLAQAVLGSLECHGTGGWETWSTFGLRVEVPETFTLQTSKLMTGRLECEWTQPKQYLPVVPPWARFDERIGLVRVSAANVLLEKEALIDWCYRTQAQPDKKRIWGAHSALQVLGHEGWLLRGVPRDLRKRSAHWAGGKRNKLPVEMQMRVWHDEPTNKILLLTTDLRPANVAVIDDLLEGLENT